MAEPVVRVTLSFPPERAARIKQSSLDEGINVTQWHNLAAEFYLDYLKQKGETPTTSLT